MQRLDRRIDLLEIIVQVRRKPKHPRILLIGQPVLKADTAGDDIAVPQPVEQISDLVAVPSELFIEGVERDQARRQFGIRRRQERLLAPVFPDLFVPLPYPYSVYESE